MILCGLSSMSGVLAPLLVAGAIGIYALVYPLRLGRLINSPAFLGVVAKYAKLSAAMLAAAICSFVGINSGNQAVAVIGNLAMMATTLAAGALFLWSFSLAIRRIVGAARQAISSQLEDWRIALAIAIWRTRPERS